ncbi:MAG: LysM peptidoglycan-binding domain-containing protein [Solirubrobacterales bacterium]
MKGQRTAATRLLAPIAVVVLAAALLFVVATTIGGSDSNGDGRGGSRSDRAAAKPDEKFYTVEPGDSLTAISNKTGVGVDKLTRLNPDLDPQALISGQRVKLR